jgi:hypothetical protein
MRTLLLSGLSAALLVAGNMVAQDANLEEVDKSPVEAKFTTGGQIRMDLCSSGIEIRGGNEDKVRVSYRPMAGQDVRVRLQISGDRADLKVRGCPHGNFQITIEIPRSTDLYVRMFAGELNVGGVHGDKDVQLHFGHLAMEIGKPGDCARVAASVNSGDLEALSFGVSKGGLFRSFEQTGPGKYRVYAHVGAGQLELR